MIRVIGLSGAQGAGKSTLLQELETRGYHVDHFKVSRVVQAEMGWDSLSRVMDSPNVMMKFQEKVLERKYDNDSKFRFLSPSVILTERTFADIYAYTTIWAYKFVDDGRLSMLEAMQYLLDFTKKCVNAQREIYGATLLLPLMDHIVWEHDVNRASKGDAESFFMHMSSFMRTTVPEVQRYEIYQDTVQKRADEVQTFLRGYLAKTGNRKLI